MAEEIPIASAAEGAANLLVQDAEAAVAPVPALDDPFPFFALHEPWDDDNGPAAHHEPDEMFADADFMHPGNHGEEPKPAPMSAYNLDVFQKCVEAGTVAVTKVANPQYESKLCNIPLECFSNVAKYLDPDSVSKLFGSCVALFAVGQHPTTRIEFLLGRYGTYSVVDGVSLHAKLVCDRVLEGVFRRVNEKLGKVPRFQLQRLFARISVTDRLDLLGPLMVYFLANYPERTTPLPTPSNLYSSTLTGSDLRVFNRLVCSPNLPRGTEYLLLLAKDQSWLQEDDASLTAMLTLKHVYGFMPGIVPFSGKTPAAEMTSYVTRSDRQRRYNHYSTGERPGLADVFVPGTDLVHGLLIASIKDKRELQVKRLLTFGATTRPAVEPIDDGKPDRVMFPMRDLPVPKFKRTMYILYKQCKKRGISSPYMTTSHGGFEEDDNIFVYGADGRLRRKFELNPFDAVEVAAIKGNVNILRMILEEDNKHGRWETPEGQETLSKCLLMCEDKLDCYDLIKAFLGGDREPAMDLMKALLDGDKDKAIELLAKGIKLSTEQISVILKSPENAQVHELVIELTNLDLNDLKNLLPSLFHTCTRHYGLMTSADAHEQHPTPAALLRKYESQMTTKEGRKFLKGYFSRQSCIQHLIRPYLGGLQEHAPSSEVLRFDLVHAVIDNDKDKMTRLVECGVKPTCWLRFLPEIPSLNTGNGQERTEGVKTFLKLGLLSKKDIQKVLEMIVRPGQRNASADLLEYLLDESNGHPVPKIKINILFCAISWLGLAETGNTLQCMLLERAIAENANIAKHRAEIDRAVARYGPNSDFAVQWASYKEKLDKEAPAEKQDKEESGDDEEDDLMSTPFYYDMPFGHDDDDLYY